MAFPDSYLIKLQAIAHSGTSSIAHFNSHVSWPGSRHLKLCHSRDNEGFNFL